VVGGGGSVVVDEDVVARGGGLVVVVVLAIDEVEEPAGLVSSVVEEDVVEEDVVGSAAVGSIVCEESTMAEVVVGPIASGSASPVIANVTAASPSKPVRTPPTITGRLFMCCQPFARLREGRSGLSSCRSPNWSALRR
jgi:hypothetical protein